MARRGLVLGGGGLVGAAWMVGVLESLSDELDATELDVLVGTSAGSVLAAALAAGVTARELVAHQRDDPSPDGPLAGLAYDFGVLGTRSDPPRPGIGSPGLAWRLLRNPGAYRLPAALAAVLPRGRAAMGGLPELVDRLLPRWPTDRTLAICAMDYATGRRRVFDAADGGTAPSTAVEASCAMPGWFSPVTVEGRDYVDGGSYSFTSVDAAAGRGLDEVYVLAPLAHDVRAAGRVGLPDRLLRWWRVPQTRLMYREAEKLRREGTRVRLFTPTADELVALGVNSMDASRRRTVLETVLELRSGTPGPAEGVRDMASAADSSPGDVGSSPRDVGRPPGDGGSSPR